MRFGIYTFYDNAANDIGIVFVAKTLNVAVRNFQNSLKDAGEMAAEFELWRLGFLETTDENSEQVTCTTKITDLFECVALGSEVMSEKKKQELRLIKEDAKNA